MSREIKYYVIGGQYLFRNYGGAYTLEGAKRLATKCEEYWDNWQGFHKPVIYKAEDCIIASNFFGQEDYYPKNGAIPYMNWNKQSKKWAFNEGE